MHSRQRLLDTLQGRQTDRVSISTYELCGYNSLSFENQQPSYSSLMDYIRQFTDSVCMWGPSSNQTFGLSAYALHIDKTSKIVGDYREEHTVIATPKGKLKKIDKVSSKIYTTWHVEPLCKNSSDVDTYLSIPYEPVSYDFSDYKRIQNEVGNHGIIMSSIADPICTAIELMDFADAMVWAMTEERHFAKTIADLHLRTMENLRRMLDTGVVDLYRIVGSEYLTPPYLPPELYKKYALPCIAEIVDLIHSHNSYARIHSHGKIAKILDCFIASGADAIDPCEAPPDGDITLAELKKNVKNTMTLFGNIQLKLLENGSQEDVRTFVKQSIREGKEGGRFVIMPTASPIDLELKLKTVDNYRMFIDTALEEGRY